jgi:hypothetical protein
VSCPAQYSDVLARRRAPILIEGVRAVAVVASPEHLHRERDATLGSTLVNWREFSTSLAGDLAWPVVVLVVLFLFREPIAKRIENLKSLKAGNFAAEFSAVEPTLDRAKEAEASRRSGEAQETRDDGTEKDKSIPEKGSGVGTGRPPERRRQESFWSSMDQQFDQIALHADENPSFAVVASWNKVEQAGSQALEEVWSRVQEGNRDFPHTGPAALNEIQRLQLVSPETAEALKEFGRLRNEVAHGALKPDVGAATAYAGGAKELTRTMVERVLANVSSRAS